MSELAAADEPVEPVEPSAAEPPGYDDIVFVSIVCANGTQFRSKCTAEKLTEAHERYLATSHWVIETEKGQIIGVPAHALVVYTLNSQREVDAEMEKAKAAEASARIQTPTDVRNRTRR